MYTIVTGVIAGMGLTATVALFLLGITALFYHWAFARRFETDSKPLPLTLSDFPALVCKPVVFQSHGETLRGGFYQSVEAESRREALLIFCHGLSNGSRDYLGQIAYFAQNGFEVLAYDNTGCHQSSGKGIRGFPQSAVNLSDVLDTLLTHPDYAAYRQKPIILMGHSWGGYASAAVLQLRDYQTVKAAVTFSAPNRGLELMVEQGKHKISPAIVLLKPFLWVIDRLKFGRYAGLEAIGGVNRSNARVLIFQGREDPVVYFSSSLAAQQPRCTNPHAEFVLLEGRDHNPVLTTMARVYAKQLQAQVAQGAPLEQLLAEANRLQLYELDEKILQRTLRFLLDTLE